MAHNTRTELDATWNGAGYVPTVADWQDLDRKVFQAVNGDRGGCWAPSTAISVVGSAGKLNIAAPLGIDYGGSLYFASGGSLRLAASDWPRFAANHALRTRKILTSCFQRQVTPDYLWLNNLALGGVQSIALSVVYPPYLKSIFAGTITPPAVIQPAFLLPLRVHDGARLTSATLSFRVPTTRAAAPLVLPRMRIVRADASGNLVVLKSVASGADPSGYVPISTASSGATWFANGVAQSFTYVCDQNNVVDLSQYEYFAQVIEEVGALVPVPAATADGIIVRERKIDVACVAASNVALTGAQTIDGQAVGGGSPAYGITDRVLLVGQTDATQNGIWTAPNGGGAWNRATDLATQSDFTPGFIVKAIGGTKYGLTMWELADPSNAQPVTVANGTGTPIHFQRRTPKGNVYIAVAANFDSIADMRWQ